jgi:spore maturation protein CgeB
MRFVLFYHSVRSDWNHGNAHFLRGVASELQSRGHVVRIYEPDDAWSAKNLVASHGEEALSAYRSAYPALRPTCYDPAALDLDEALRNADVVIVHEWNPPELIARIGKHRARGGRYALLFHDTHHRSVTDREAMAAFDLSAYDGVLAFGDVIRRLYLQRGWARRAYTWHEAADTRVFYPRAPSSIGAPQGDLVWIGNWGDEERSKELQEFLLNPVKELGLKAKVYGVRYPDHALAALRDAGIEYGGYLPNHEVPEVFAAHRVTVHVPRRAYTTLIPGIPTIRPFEALACGIPLISAPWQDTEGLFSPGLDFLVARDGAEMKALLGRVLADPAFAQSIAERGRDTITARHTCAHRTDELLRICRDLTGVREQDATLGGTS